MRDRKLAAVVLLVCTVGAGWLLLDPTSAFIDEAPVADVPPSAGKAAVVAVQAPGAAVEEASRSSPNPLSRIAVGSLDEIVERPLFDPDRRAPIVEPPAVVDIAPEPVEEPFSPDDFTLLGVVDAGAEKTALLRMNKTNEVLRLKPGQDFEGWTLRQVDDRSVVIARDGQDYPLKLFGAKPPAAPAAAPAEVTSE